MRKARSRIFAVAAGSMLTLATAFAGTSTAQTEEQVDVQEALHAMAAACQDGYLCIWEGPYGQGKRVDLFYCNQTVHLKDYGLERVGSFVNNQYDGTVAYFYGPKDPMDGDSPIVQQYTSTAFEIRDNDQNKYTTHVEACRG